LNAAVKIYISTVIILCSAAGLSIQAEELNTRQRIVLFDAGTSVQNAPRLILDTIDEQLASSFSTFEGFELENLPYRLRNEDINRFTSELRAALDKKEAVGSGNGAAGPITLTGETISGDDMSTVINSYIVIVPALSEFNETEGEEEGPFTVTAVTTLTAIRVFDTRTMARFSVRAEGRGEDRDEAVEKAAEQAALLLNEEVSDIPLFRVTEGIINILRERKVVISFGKDRGVKQGDIFGILDQDGNEAGRLIVERVEKDHSFARVFYAEKPLQIGDRVVKKEYAGGVSIPYLHTVIGFDANPFKAVTVGVRQTFSRGFFLLRPLIGLEVPFLFGLDPVPFPFGFHVRLYAGGEMNWYAGRVLVAPRVAGGIGLSTDEQVGGLTHAGFLAEITVSHLLSQRLRLFGEFGYTYWFGFDDTPGYGGWVVGLGLIIHY
jgi:hypothetical protein